MKNRAFFLDRDGVINVEVSYLCDPDQAELIPGVPEAIQTIHRAGFLVIVTTNQSGVARGMYDLEAVQRVHARLQSKLLAWGSDAVPDAWFCCPHHPEHSGNCNCRKPAPGMLLRAAKDFNIDTAASFMVGDRLSDLMAGCNAGCKASCLVLTGYGANEVAKAESGNFPIADDLGKAAEMCLKL